MKTNIVFVTENSFPYYSGGIENWLYNMAIRLCVDYNVYVISEPPTFYNKVFYDLPDEVVIVNYSSLRSFRGYRALLKGDLGYWDYRFRERAISAALSKLVSKLDGKVIVVSLGTIAAASASFKVKIKNPRLVFVCSARGPHAEIMSRKYNRHQSYLYNTEELNLKRSDIALTNGFDTQQYFKKRGISSIVMKNGVDFGRFQIKTQERVFLTEDKVILSIGTLWDVKCISELINAYALIRSKGRMDVSLYFAGKGDAERYKQEANRLGVGDKVFFLGHRNDIPSLSQQADLIACLSDGGGFSMAALEAMASGTPVIAWDTPVYTQFNLEEERITTVPYKNVEKLSYGILMCLDCPEESKKRADRACSYAESFDWSYVVKDFIRYVDK